MIWDNCSLVSSSVGLRRMRPACLACRKEVRASWRCAMWSLHSKQGSFWTKAASSQKPTLITPPAGRNLGVPQRFTAPSAWITLGASGGVRARPGVSWFSPQLLKAWSGAEGTGRACWGGQLCRRGPTAPSPAFFSLVLSLIAM